MSVDPESFTPLYHQLATILRDLIDTGELAPGQMLPSEQALMDEFQIGRAAVRDALRLLRAEGRIVTYRRRGSFVRDEADRDLVSVPRDTRVIGRMPTPGERRELGIPEGVPVFVITAPGEAPRLLPSDRTELVFEG